MNNFLKTKKSGSALPLVIVTVVILLTMGLGMLSLGLQSRVYAVRTSDKIAAQVAADAGLVKALYEMNQKLRIKPWDSHNLPITTNESLPNCNQSFSYIVTGNMGSGFTIESVGQSGYSQKKVTGILRLRGPFEYSIFSESRVDLANSSLVTGYNFDENGGNVRIGTNSTEPDSIILRNSATVEGDVFVGMGGDADTGIELKTGANVTGQTSTMSEKIELDPVMVPSWLRYRPFWGTIRDSQTITNSGKYRGINLKNGNIIKIDGAVGLFITGDVILGNSAEIQIVETNPNASLTLYLGGDFEGKNSSAINNLTKDPKKLKIFGLDSSERMLFKNKTDFYGAIYAPSADVIFDNSADAYGAVAANSFVQRNSATFNYDASLREVAADNVIVEFTIQRWHE